MFRLPFARRSQASDALAGDLGVQRSTRRISLDCGKGVSTHCGHGLLFAKAPFVEVCKQFKCGCLPCNFIPMLFLMYNNVRHVNLYWMWEVAIVCDGHVVLPCFATGEPSNCTASHDKEHPHTMPIYAPGQCGNREGELWKGNCQGPSAPFSTHILRAALTAMLIGIGTTSFVLLLVAVPPSSCNGGRLEQQSRALWRTESCSISIPKHSIGMYWDSPVNPTCSSYPVIINLTDDWRGAWAAVGSTPKRVGGGARPAAVFLFRGKGYF